MKKKFSAVAATVDAEKGEDSRILRCTTVGWVVDKLQQQQQRSQQEQKLPRAMLHRSAGVATPPPASLVLQPSCVARCVYLVVGRSG